MMQKDNEAACVSFVQFGASLKATTVVAPRIDLSYCPGRVVAGDTDGLTLSLKDVGAAKHFFDISKAIKASPTPEIA